MKPLLGYGWRASNAYVNIFTLATQGETKREKEIARGLFQVFEVPTGSNR
jgi:hypothetical protein